MRTYELKNEITSSKKIQRLLKTIDTNAKEDRKEAKDLLKKVKEELSDYLESPPMDEAGNPLPIGDTFHKLVQSAVLALNQAGIANERLLKLATLLQKFNPSNEKDPLKQKELKGSLFAGLDRLVNGKKDEED